MNLVVKNAGKKAMGCALHKCFKPSHEPSVRKSSHPSSEGQTSTINEDIFLEAATYNQAQDNNLSLVSDALLIVCTIYFNTDTENDMESSNENQATTSSTPYKQTDLSSNDRGVILNAFHDSLANADSIS